MVNSKVSLSNSVVEKLPVGRTWDKRLPSFCVDKTQKKISFVNYGLGTATKIGEFPQMDVDEARKAAIQYRTKTGQKTRADVLADLGLEGPSFEKPGTPAKKAKSNGHDNTETIFGKRRRGPRKLKAKTRADKKKAQELRETLLKRIIPRNEPLGQPLQTIVNPVIHALEQALEDIADKTGNKHLTKFQKLELQKYKKQVLAASQAFTETGLKF